MNIYASRSYSKFPDDEDELPQNCTAWLHDDCCWCSPNACLALYPCPVCLLWFAGWWVVSSELVCLLVSSHLCPTSMLCVSPGWPSDKSRWSGLYRWFPRCGFSRWSHTLLLRSQLYHWGSPFLVMFLYMQLFFNHTVESHIPSSWVMHARCVGFFWGGGGRVVCLFVFAGIHCLGHECQDLLICTMERICAQTRPQFILSPKRVLGNGVRTHVDFKGKITSTGRPRGGLNLWCCIMQGREPSTLRTEVFLPWTSHTTDFKTGAPVASLLCT